MLCVECGYVVCVCVGDCLVVYVVLYVVCGEYVWYVC